jgi:hypothetical protein
MMNSCPLRGRSSVISLMKRPERGSLLKGLKLLEARVVLLLIRRPRLLQVRRAALLMVATISEVLRVT